MSNLSSATRPARGGKRDYRMAALALAITGTAVLGYLLNLMPGSGVSAPAVVKAAAIASSKSADLSSLQPTSPKPDVVAEELVPEPRVMDKNADPKTSETDKILNEATKKVRAKQYDQAIAELNQSRDKIQHVPQSYVVMASALAGKKDFEAARDFYNSALDKDPYLAEAYFGFALTSEALGDLESAIGGMRNFLHVQPNADPQKLKIVQARSAIWEWESKLGRGPWGPTKGIPPGYSADELKRDGRGVAIKMPIPGTQQADGRSKYEIKHSDKFQIFKP